MRSRCAGWALGFLLTVVLLSPGMVWFGCGGGGGGDGSTPLPPAAPSSVTANPGDNQATLSWSSVSGATSYNVYYRTAPGVTKATGTKVSGVQSPNVVSGLTNGTPYYFVVTAVNSGGESAESAERSATPTSTPPPPAPTGVRATAGDNTVTVSWDAAAGATSYNIYYRTAAGVTKTNGTPITGATSPRVVTGLTNGTAYYFVVTAVNANGESAESFEVSATPAATPPPAAPGGVSATPGDGQASVSWSAVTGATSYNLYWATSSGVTKTTGTKIPGVTSPRVVTGLANGTKHYFVVTAVNANGESTESSEVSATPVAPAATFSQADLTGNWDGIFFDTGSGSGWVRVVATINSSGGITVTSLLDSAGGTTPPPAGSITWTISAAGVVSESGPSGSASFYGQMSSNKLLVIGKEGAAGSSSATLRVFRKRTGTAFSSADLANKTFKFHGLRSGTDNAWSWGAGTTNASNVVTITEEWTPSGQQPPGSGGTLSVSSAGIVTDSTDSTSYGLMTDDKKVIFMINGGSNNYGLIVITITGQNYTQSDYEGIFNFFAIRNNVPNPGWSYGVASVDAAGNGTYLSYTDSGGGAAPGAFQRVLSAIGVVTDPADATAHGQMSYNKDITVRTNTNAAGRYGIVIGFK